MRPGVLALQGCVDPHLEMFKRLGVPCARVREARDLESIDRLILPGGESTTLLVLLEKQKMFNELVQFGRSFPVWGICAGAILLAKEVQHPAQRSLALMNICAIRNFYGSQRESFSEEIEVSLAQIKTKVKFIRAPSLKALGAEVEVLARLGDQAVFLREKKLWACAFHVELGEDTRLHEAFLNNR